MEQLFVSNKEEYVLNQWDIDWKHLKIGTWNYN